MPETTPGGFEYPTGEDPADLERWIGGLAFKLEEKIGTQAAISDVVMRAAALASPTDGNFAGALAAAILAQIVADTGRVKVAAQGASIGTATLTGGVLNVVVSTPWSMDANGNVDYSPTNTPPAGYNPAVLSIDPTTGNPVVTKIAS